MRWAKMMDARRHNKILCQAPTKITLEKAPLQLSAVNFKNLAEKIEKTKLSLVI